MEIMNQKNRDVMVQQQSANSTARPQPRDLGINVEKPKFPQYAVPSKRLQSFDSWPAYLPVLKEELVDAGLVYTGVEDSVRCYYCGGGLRNWERGDVPMEEHAKWYPKCPHVLLVKGQGYIDKLTKDDDIDEDGSERFEKLPIQGTRPNHLESDAALSCLDMGFSKDSVAKAIKIYLKKNNGNATFKGKDLCEIIFDIEDESQSTDVDSGVDDCVGEASCHQLGQETTDSYDDLLAENERLKQDKVCKICLENFADVIFLPCGHMVSCPQCAPALTKCPICRQTINGHIKAFFAVVSSQQR